MDTSRQTASRFASWLWAFITLIALGAVVLAIAVGDRVGLAYVVFISVSAAGAFALIGAWPAGYLRRSGT